MYFTWRIEWQPLTTRKKRMVSRPCCVWFMTHLTSALVKPQFISLGLFLISYSSICFMAQSAPRGKSWQSRLPAHASTRRRRRAADTVSQPKEHMKHPTAQSQAPETSCTLTLTQSHQMPGVRPAQERCSSSGDCKGILLHREGQGSLHWLSGDRGRQTCYCPESLSQHWWRNTLSASQISQDNNLF